MKLRALILCSLLFALPLSAQEEKNSDRGTSRRGESSTWNYRDATVLSMMGWGVGLAAGIALLAGLLHQSAVKAPTTGG